MKCPKCGNRKVNIIDSRQAPGNRNNITRRIRICPSCKHRFSTFEIMLSDLESKKWMGPFRANC